jgi:hypothetical protein
MGNNIALFFEYGYNINRLILITHLILECEKRAKMLGFSVNICYPSKNARYSIGQRHGFILLFPYLLVHCLQICYDIEMGKTSGFACFCAQYQRILGSKIYPYPRSGQL